MEGIQISLLVGDHGPRILFRGWRQYPAAEGGHVCERICGLECIRNINKLSNNIWRKKIQHLIGKGEENYKRLLDSSREEFLPLMTSYGTGQTNRLTTGRHLGSRKIDPLYTSSATIIPVVPHKAVAEVSKVGNYRRGELLWFMDGRANPLMDRNVVGFVLFGVVAMVAVVTSPQLLDVVWCSAVVVVVVG